MNKRRTWKLTICIILLLIVAVCNVPLNKEINASLPAIQGRIGDNEYFEEITITINGVYKNYLFKEDQFEGTISISNYDFTKVTPILPIQFSKGEGDLVYGSSTIYMKPLGTIFCTPNFSKILITVREPIGNIVSSWNNQNSLYITAPAKTLEQSHVLAESLSDWFINITQD